MAEASCRAARPVKRGGLPNALFVVAAAESLPPELDGWADAITVHFPWGSLLRGLLEGEHALLAGIARVTQPGATLTLLLSVTERDHVGGVRLLDECTFTTLAPAYAVHGLILEESRPATEDDLARSHSTWAKRLTAGAQRPVWFARFRRSYSLTGTRAAPRAPEVETAKGTQ
jgi:16S rRNA (adenine(1408)-N(1))-methyltransferase